MDSDRDPVEGPDFYNFNKNWSKSDEEDDKADRHSHFRHPQDEVYTPDSQIQKGTLRFPDNCADESYLVLSERDPEIIDPPEEPVRSKPQGARGRGRHRADTSDSDTSQGGGGGGAGGACVRINRQSRREPNLRRDSPPDQGATGYTADDDVEKEAASTVHSDVTASVVDIQYPVVASKTVVERVPHALFCNGVSRWKIRPHRFPIVLRGFIKFVQHGIKITNFTLHCRGLDQDYNQHYATLTAVVHFQPNQCLLARCLLEYSDCKITLSVEVFVESVERGRKLGTAYAERWLRRDERDLHKMHMTVYKVVDLDEIVYNLSEVCPDNILLRITASVEAYRIQVSAADIASGFVDVSTSVERLPSL